MMKHRKREESSMEELYNEVIEEILLRLPLKSLGKCKLVSRAWNSLISKQEFAKAHLQFPNHIGNPPSFLIAFQDFETISMLKYDSPTNMITPLDQQFGPRSYGVFCFLVGSCDGLVCLWFKKKGKSEDLMYLWNPTTNKHTNILLPVEQGLTYLLVKSCWLGFVPSLNTYKIFLVYNTFRPFVEHKYVCSLRDHKWREIRETNEVDYREGIRYHTFATRDSISVVMNEVVHLLVGHDCIHRFDLVAESCDRVNLSMKFDVLGVVGKNKCLCAMDTHCSKEGIFDLWILEEYNEWDSWKMLYKINLRIEIVRNGIIFFGFTDSGYLCVQGGNGLNVIDLSHNPPLFVINNLCSLPAYQFIDQVESIISPLSLL